MATVVEAPPAAETARYIPGLDGLRALAVLGVCCYHGSFGWARGGFLGVSTFFTLSGFLITTLLLREHTGGGRVDFRRFWGRRARRLLPASLLTLAGVLVFHNAFAGLETAHLRGDVIAAVGYVENWWLIHNHQAYGAIFTAASPVQHFWSLAIEEQFYLFFPLLFVAVHRVFRRRSGAATTFAALAAGSLVWGALMAHGGDETRAYYSTFSRAGELLIGVVLAYAVERVDFGRVRAVRAFDVGGAVGVVGLLLLWWRVDLHDSWLFPVGIAANAGLTLLVILACLARAQFASVLSIAPLRRLGMISYGVYLVHWPVFLWLDDSRLSVSIGLLFVVRMAVTIAIATVMFVVVESPVRHRTRLRGASFVPSILAAMAAVVVGALIVPEATALAIDVNNPPSVTSQLDTLNKVTPAAGTQRVLLVGDSVGWSAWVGLNEWGKQHHVDVQNDVIVGCGIGGAGKLRYLGLVRSTPPDCAAFDESVAKAIARYNPDTVLMLTGLADLSPRQFPDGTYKSIGDPEFDARLIDRIRTLTRIASAKGARVLWATYPHVDVKPEPDGTGSPPFPENDPARVDKLNELIRTTAATLPNTKIVDFASFVHDHKGGEFDPSFRPDGVHLALDGTKEAALWLGPQLTQP